MKNILIGKADIKTLLEGNYIYVDKTKYIYNLVKKPDIYFLSRPRRFGKSLLVSTFIEIFSGNKELFKECWIYNTDYDWKNYPIIHLDFGTTKQDLRKNFYDVLFNRLKEIAESYELTIVDSSLNEYFNFLIKKLYEKEGPIVFLVDEYDKPILDSIDDLKMADENRNILGGIFNTAKSLSGMIHFQFVTGITRFAKTSLFSGPNNLFDISMDLKYNNLLGYTQKELEFYFHEYIDLILKEKELILKDKCDLISKIKSWYNGYLFSHEGNNKLETIYNPFSIANFFSKKFFNNYWFNTATPTFLIKLLNRNVYETIKDKNNIYLHIDELNKFDIDIINFRSLLFQAGYLTIESYDSEIKMIKLKYPNEEVEDSFLNVIEAGIVNDVSKYSQENAIKAKKALENKDWNEFFREIKIIIATVPYLYHKNEESFYAAIVTAALRSFGFNCSAETMTNDGRIDMKVDFNKELFIFEFKINATENIAMDQIKRKEYFNRFLGLYDEIYLIGVNFSFERKNLNKFIVEKVENE